jgi:hypothetical protein
LLEIGVQHMLVVRSADRGRRGFHGSCVKLTRGRHGQF